MSKKRDFFQEFLEEKISINCMSRNQCKEFLQSIRGKFALKSIDEDYIWSKTTSTICFLVYSKQLRFSDMEKEGRNFSNSIGYEIVSYSCFKNNKFPDVKLKPVQI